MLGRIGEAARAKISEWGVVDATQRSAVMGDNARV